MKRQREHLTSRDGPELPEDVSLEHQRYLVRPLHMPARHQEATGIVEPASATSPFQQAKHDLLYLFLGLHTNSNIPGTYDYLTMHELANLKCVSKDLRAKLATVDYTHCYDGNDYLLPFPGIPGVMKKGGGLFPHQLASLRAMYKAENRTKEYGALRGGILGDAPGLGKTVTLLALVASTAGQRVVAPSAFWDESSNHFAEAWASARGNESTSRSINEVTLHLRRWLEAEVHPSSPEAKLVREVLRNIQPPYLDNRFPTVQSLENYVRRSLTRVVPPLVLDQLRQGFVSLRAGMDKRSRRLLASPNGRYLRWERSLIPSCATLIIVPDALFEHWFQQIQKHVDLRTFAETTTSKHSDVRNVVYLDGCGDMNDLVGSHAFLKDINLKQKVAPPWHLSQYLMVITTFSRCVLHLKDEHGAGRLVNKSKKRIRDAVESDSGSTSPFLKIRWLRLVVDEGHELGEHEAGSDVTRFVNQIAAERRWVLSGTPVVGDEDDEDYSVKVLDQLQRLLFFLRHPEYGHLSESQAERRNSNWAVRVKAPYLAREQAGKQELMRVLNSIMVMHRKEDINLPSPLFIQVERVVNVPLETESVLLAACGPSQHLVKNFDEYLHSSAFQSLVDETQAEYIVSSLQDARKEFRHCGCRVIDELGCKFSDIRPIKAVVYSSNHNVLLSVTEFILRRLGQENVSELYASERVGAMNAELARFRHGIKECKCCPICGREETDLAIMETGIGCTNQLMEVVSTDGLYRRFLIEPERIQETINVFTDRMDGEPLSSYAKSQKFWRLGDKLIVDIRNPHPVLTPRISEQAWHDMGSARCKDLALMDRFAGQDWYFGPLPDDIDDSGHLEVTLRKWQPCRRFHGARWYTGPRMSDEPLQKVQEDVFLLALDAELAHGLDLSFVTHIFLLEPIKDAALLEQVTSRAHRIGASAPVMVVTVNTHFEVSNEFQKMLEAGPGHAKRMEQSKTSALETVVCDHCYRSFASRAAAEAHERTNCPRNPANVQLSDPFHLSSVYQEIKPPPAVKVHVEERV